MTLIAGSTREQSRTLAADVFARLRADILACRLKPGAALRFETLKESYGASFSTLREALTALVAEGLVASEGQRGFSVARVSRSDLLDLTDARVLIERELLKLAIQNGGDEWEIATAAALHRMSLLEQRHSATNFVLTPEWQLAHAAFHEALVAPSGSSILLAVRASLYARAERYRSLSAIYRKVKRHKIDEHKAIMQAAFSRKVEKAQSLLDRHIRSTTANVLEFAREILETPP
jgi:DNA-binding GntR family transcriptional regulator